MDLAMDEGSEELVPEQKPNNDDCSSSEESRSSSEESREDMKAERKKILSWPTLPEGKSTGCQLKLT